MLRPTLTASTFVVLAALGCDAPSSSSPSIVGAWQLEGSPETVLTFTGGDEEGRFSWHNLNGASLPPGCRETIAFGGAYSVTSAVITLSAESADITRSDCADPIQNMPAMPLPGSSGSTFAANLSGPVIVAVSRLTIEGPSGTAMFVRAASATVDGGLSPVDGH
jgi:hypothetical protein